jgi:class 3 adenylate cyclase/tetratricopeptide (TPR) repeat protein
MECSRCRTANREERRFCAECGAPLIEACATCGFGNEAGERFCGGCGAPLGDGGSAPFQAGRPEGERRQVSVLFADVVGFTCLSQRLDPESVHEIMDGCFGLLTREVERYGGRVNAFTGDGVMALFGAPLAEEDHAIRGLHAALQIQRALGDYSEDLRRRFEVSFQMRIGVNSGLVVAAGIGDHHPIEYTALGDTINLASRLEQAAPPGGVLAGELTYRAAGEAFIWREVGALRLKGISDSVVAYEVIGPSTTHGRFEVLAQRGLTSFVGRRNELGQLVGAWERAAEGRGQVVSIVGEAGLGKSRLLHEFKGELARRGVAFHEGSCFTYGETISYLPFLEILRALLGLDSSTSDVAATRVIDQRLSKLSLAAELATYLVNMLGLEGADEIVRNQSAGALRQRTLEALRNLIVAQAMAEPMALIVEDVHWIDKASEEVLSVVVEAMVDVPLLVVLVYRPEYLHAWGNKAYHAEISLTRLGGASSAAMVRAILSKPYAASVALERLSPEDSQAMVRQLLGAAEIPPELEVLVETYTDGNPLFIEEFTRDLLETGDLVREGDAYVLTRAPESLELPTTVQGVLLARIDRLNPDLRSLLQIASVLGRVFSHDLLGTVAQAIGALDQALLQLEDLDFVYPTSLAPDRQYSFKHVLAQEAVYQTLLRARREAYHERAAQAIEALYAERLEEFYELLAYHYGRSGNDDKAVEYLDLANQKATRANSMEEAKRHFDEAMKLLDRMPDTASNRHRRLSLLANQFLVFFMLYRLPEYDELMTKHLELIEQLDDMGLRGVLYKCIGHYQWLFGETERSLRTLSMAQELVEAAGNVYGAGMVYSLLGWVRLTTANFDEVAVWEAKALQAFEQEFEPHYYMWSRAAAAWAYAYQGSWVRAVEEGQEGLRAGAEHRDDSATCFSAFVLCDAYIGEGNLDAALEYGELAVRVAPTPADEVWSRTWLAKAWMRAGRVDEAIELLEQLLPAYEATRFAYGAACCGLYLGEAFWRAGRFDEGRAVLQKTADLAERTQMPFHVGSCNRVLGEIDLDTDPTPDGFARATREFEHSMALFDRMQAKNELAMAYAGYGRLRGRCGDAEAAARFSGMALEIFDRLGTTIDPVIMRD